jgi:putative salt-induced outer membrane protein YdiY
MNRSAFLCVTLLFLAAASLRAQEEGWSWDNATELSFVSTGGNASSNTFGLKASLTGTSGENEFKIEVGGIRAESERTLRTATGDPTSYVVTTETISEVTAESYFLKGRYDRQLGPGFAFGGAGWERNTFAGIRSRSSVVGGLGRTWIDSDSGRFKTDIGGTYTIEKAVEPDPDADEAFGGLRITIDAQRSVTATTDLASIFIADENLEERGDLRADWTTSVTVAISEGLALKTSLQLLYDSEPAFVSVPLVDNAGAPTGQNVRTPGDKLDNVLTLTLVIRL